jgi:hypothetical protein
VEPFQRIKLLELFSEGHLDDVRQSRADFNELRLQALLLIRCIHLLGVMPNRRAAERPLANLLDELRIVIACDGLSGSASAPALPSPHATRSLTVAAPNTRQS